MLNLSNTESRQKRLKKYRLERDISIYKLAEDIGINYSSVSYWENGKKYPRHDMIIALEDYFNRPYRDLFTDLTDKEIKILDDLQKLKKMSL